MKSEEWNYYNLGAKDIDIVTRVLNSGKLACGKEVELFEQEFSTFVGRKFAIATSSGTTALQLLLHTYNFPFATEVVVPSLTFIATVNAIVLSALKPVFSDIDEYSLTITEETIKSVITDKTLLILGVDLFGQIPDWNSICDKFKNIIVLEDACQSLGSYRGEKKAGTFGSASVFSFFSNKLLSTCEGGMILTDDEELAESLYRIRSQGRLISDRLGYHLLIGSNYRMSEVHAALGRSQLSIIDKLINKRRELIGLYYNMLKEFDDSVRPAVTENNDGYIMPFFPIYFDNTYNIDDCCSKLLESSIPIKRTYIPVHMQPAYEQLRTLKAELPITERLGPQIISLPLHSGLDENDIAKYISTIKNKILSQKGKRLI